MRHERDGESSLVDRGNRQRHAVDGDRALLDEVAAELRRRVDPDGLARASYTAEAVDVPLHDVAAERLARPQPRLGVDAAARREPAERRPPEPPVDARER